VQFKTQKKKENSASEFWRLAYWRRCASFF